MGLDHAGALLLVYINVVLYRYVYHNRVPGAVEWQGMGKGLAYPRPCTPRSHLRTSVTAP